MSQASNTALTAASVTEGTAPELHSAPEDREQGPTPAAEAEPVPLRLRTCWRAVLQKEMCVAWSQQEGAGRRLAGPERNGC